ncbi:rolling circle replication-associated protein [Sinanaerobacter chloroacetimidivorans]|uniref:Replication-associated protein ORF2/G2P domain-containing protein n=1 Tax=Sinanaerobacter chloroacetimidivorans TaxID=2818044 RepID=A0A8J8AZW3_9FIRM|nr:hypothetical protein [Sinanaerobacter chloroacetimidivorans]MBR0596604.1 hypothetical protein [Sinanaerobacter chloroacetimidivorans]
MSDIFRLNLGDGCQLFEHHGYVYTRYNAKLKVAGDSVKVCFYEKGVLSGFSKNKRKDDSDDEKPKVEYDPEKRWYQTGLRARRDVYDTVSANLHKHLDHNGKKQRFKMFTATFRENVKKYKKANSLFNDFIGRLNYHFTGEKGANFLKYLAIPELQMENSRYVWHFHILFFNMPYLPVSGQVVDRLIEDGRLPKDYDKRDTLFYIWGMGGVEVDAINFSDTYDIAGYVCKYIGKGLDGLFEYAREEGNLKRRRYLKSTGLMGPKIMIAFLNKQQRQAIADYFRKHCKKFKRKGELGKFYETFLVENEAIEKYYGRIFGINFRSPKKHIWKLENMFERFSYGFC